MAASSTTVKVEVRSFAEDDFDVKAWVNTALASRYNEAPSLLKSHRMGSQLTLKTERNFTGLEILQKLEEKEPSSRIS